MKITDCRPEVQDFACAMEIVLRDNDHKGGWQGCSEAYLERRLVEELDEYFSTLPISDKTRTLKEIVDVANFAMMLWDIHRTSPRPPV